MGRSRRPCRAEHLILTNVSDMRTRGLGELNDQLQTRSRGPSRFQNHAPSTPGLGLPGKCLLGPRKGVLSPSVLAFFSQVSTGLPVASICWAWPCSLKQENKQGIDTSNPKPPSAPNSALGRGHSPAPTLPAALLWGSGLPSASRHLSPNFWASPQLPPGGRRAAWAEPLPGPPSLPPPAPQLFLARNCLRELLKGRHLASVETSRPSQRSPSASLGKPTVGSFSPHLPGLAETWPLFTG